MKKKSVVLALSTVALATIIAGCSTNQTNPSTQNTTQSSKKELTREEVIEIKKKEWKESAEATYRGGGYNLDSRVKNFSYRKNVALEFLEMMKNTPASELLYDEETKSAWEKEFVEKFGYYNEIYIDTDDREYEVLEVDFRELKELLDNGYSYSEDYVVPAIIKLSGDYYGVKVLFEKDGEFAETYLLIDDGMKYNVDGTVEPLGENEPIFFEGYGHITYLSW